MACHAVRIAPPCPRLDPAPLRSILRQRPKDEGAEADHLWARAAIGANRGGDGPGLGGRERRQHRGGKRGYPLGNAFAGFEHGSVAQQRPERGGEICEEARPSPCGKGAAMAADRIYRRAARPVAAPPLREAPASLPARPRAGGPDRRRGAGTATTHKAWRRSGGSRHRRRRSRPPPRFPKSRETMSWGAPTACPVRTFPMGAL